MASSPRRAPAEAAGGAPAWRLPGAAAGGAPEPPILDAVDADLDRPHCTHCCLPLCGSPSAAVDAHAFHARCCFCIACGDPQPRRVHYSALYCPHCFARLEAAFPRCFGCRRRISPTADRPELSAGGARRAFHFPGCFRCGACHRQLRVGECHLVAGQLRCPACIGAAARRASGDASRAPPVPAFACDSCGAPVDTQNGVFLNGTLNCRACAASQRVRCAACGRKTGEDRLRACGCAWHPACLKCHACGFPLADSTFTIVGGRPCCSQCRP
jgi:hypothetical protein